MAKGWADESDGTPWHAVPNNGVDDAMLRQELLDGTIEGALAWLARWHADGEAGLATVAEAVEQVAKVTATTHSARGEVEVTVGAAGKMVDLRFSDEVRGWHPDEIAAEVLRLAESAHEQLTAAMAELTLNPVGDSQEMRVVIDSYLTESRPI